LDIHEYTTSKAVDGLFTVFREEEKKIREDPTHRASSLIQSLFH